MNGEGSGAVVMAVNVMILSPASSARLLTPIVGLVITGIFLDGLQFLSISSTDHVYTGDVRPRSNAR
jgi:hypothetical protein